MQALTNDRMKWGAAALLTALLIAGFRLAMTLPTPRGVARRAGEKADLRGIDPHSRSMRGAHSAGANRSEAGTGASPYALEAHEHRTGAYNSYFTLRLYNAVSGRTIWRQTVRGYGTAGDFKGWSPDRRALALPVQPFAWPRPEAILFWRAGHRIWLCPRQRGGENDDYEFGEFVWSKDKSRVLFRGGYSGAADVDLGTLYCADLRKRKLHPIDYGVRKMEWMSENTARYWKVSPFDEEARKIVISPHFRTWHCP